MSEAMVEAASRAAAAPPVAAGAADARPPAAESPRALAQTAARGVAWSLLATIAARVVSLVSLAALARLLSPTEFGLVAFALVYLTYVETVVDLGSGAALIWWPGDRDEAAQASFVTGVATSFGWVALTVAAAPFVAAFFREPAGAPLLRVLAFTLLVKALGNTHDALCQKELRFRARVVPELGNALTKAGLSVALAAAGMGAWSLAWGQLGGQAVWTALTWRVVRWRPRWRWPRGVVRPMLSYGRRIVSVNVLAAVVHHADLVVVGRLLGATALGLYQVAYKLPETAVTVLVWVTSRVLFPALSRLNARGEPLGRGWLAAVGATSLLTFPAAAGLAVLATPVVNLFFGPRWAAAGPVLAGLAVAAGVRSAGTSAGDLLKAAGRPGLLAALSVVKAVTLVPALILAARGGATAVAWTLAATTLATALLSVAVAGRYARVPLSSYGRAVAPAAGVALLVAGGAWLGLQAGGLALALAAAGLAFVAGARLLAPEVLRGTWAALSGRHEGPRRAGRLVTGSDEPRLLGHALAAYPPRGRAQRFARALPGPIARTLVFHPDAGPAEWPGVTAAVLAGRDELRAAIDRGLWVATERVSGRIDRGALLALFEERAAEPRAALKLRPLGEGGGALAREAAVLESLRGRLPHALAATIPRPLDYASSDGWEALLLPWMPGRSPYVELHASLRPERHVRGHLGPAVEWLAAVQPFTATPGGTADAGPAVPLVLGHGDYWVRNILLQGGAVSAVLDWEHAREGRPATEDLFHLVLTYGLDYPWMGRGRVGPADAFRCAFLEPSPVAREIALALRRFCEATGLDARRLRPLFDAHLSASEVHRGRAPMFLEALRRARWSVFAA